MSITSSNVPFCAARNPVCRDQPMRHSVAPRSLPSLRSHWLFSVHWVFRHAEGDVTRTSATMAASRSADVSNANLTPDARASIVSSAKMYLGMSLAVRLAPHRRRYAINNICIAGSSSSGNGCHTQKHLRHDNRAV